MNTTRNLGVMALPLMMPFVAVAYISISGGKAKSATKEFGFSGSLGPDSNSSHC
jgi:hypothetical protein